MTEYSLENTDYYKLKTHIRGYRFLAVDEMPIVVGDLNPTREVEETMVDQCVCV